MARQHNRPYEPEFASLTNNSNSPLSPPAGPDTPISFRTNVNRAKTKRWVEAKKASYDGNDWGEDEWDEYDDDSTPPVPQPPPNANQSTGDIPSMLSRDAARPPPIPAAMDRSRSMDHVATLGADSGPVSRGRSAERNLGETADRQAPIMRPADIYRRMQEQPQSGQEPSSWPNRPTEIPSGVGPPPSITTETVPNSHPLGREMSGDPLPHSSLSTAAEATSAQEKPSEGLSVQHDSFASRLPDVKRLSGFGADFFAGSAPSAQKDQTLESAQEQQLHHHPSFGYRSVVHQAFDVETPSTTVDSVERSNSGSTSAISPIIPSRAFGGEDEKTPTIVEEPESTSPPKDFKFGHRRDLSVPSPGNSPSRQPVFNNNDNIPTSSLAEVATHNPPGVHQDYPSSRPTDTYATPSQSPTHIPPGDRPSPLRITTQPAEESRANPESVPVIIPSLSTDDSPQDTESDRLRKDIIRSLSRENTPSDEPDQQDGSRPQTGRQDSLIPSEYERYWNDEASSTPQEQKLSVGYQPSQNNSQDLLASSAAPPSAPVPAAAPAEQGSRPQFKRRFSWESSSSDDLAAAPPVAGVQSPPGVDMPGQFPQTVEAPAPPTITVEQDPTDANRKSIQEKPKLTIITPAAMDSSSVSSDRVLPEVVDHPHREPTPYPENVQSADSEYQTPSLGPTAPPSIESNLLGFRDILGKKTSEERVEAFNQTRDQFASINTGLNHWIQVTVHAHPEHADVVGQSYSLSSAAPKPTMSRGKFPKLPSLGTFGTSEGSPSGSGHVRRPSAPLGSMMNKQQVEQRGKDLLHTAGVLGGKTGKAAKGLFAKGRSKFMGGNEKGFQTTRGYRRNIRRSEFEFSDDIDFSALDSHDARQHTEDGDSVPWTRDARPFVDHPEQFDIQRKGIVRDEPSRAAGNRPEYVRALEQQMSAALGLQGDDPSSAAAANLGRDQACPDVGREFEALANKHGGAGGAAWESSYFDSSAMTGPLQPRDEAELLQTTATTPKMPTVALHESERPGSRERYTDGAGEVEQAKADFTRPSESPWPSPPLLPTTSSCHPPHHVPALLVRPGSAATVTAVSMMGPSAPVSNAPREPHRRGSSAPLQLHPMASVSSLGTLPDLDTDVDLHRPRRIMFGPASWSRVSLPSDMDDAPRILGDEEAEQCAAVRLTPSTPEHDHDHPWSLSPSAKHDSKARSTMDRIVGKIRRPSNPTDPKASSPSQPQLKKPLDRLGGLFSRQHGRSHEPPPTPSVVAESLPGPEPHTPEPSSYPPSMDRLRPSTSQPPTPGHPPFNTSPGHTRPSSSLADTSFQGQLPPPGGYFAPDSFAQFRDAQDVDLKLAQQINAENIDRGVGGSHRIPSPVGIPRHSGSGRSAGSISGQSSLSPNSPRYPAPASPPLHQPHTYHHPASPYYQHHHHHQQQQQQQPPPPPQHPQPYTTHLVSPVPSPVPRTPPSRGRSQERTYAQELHLRSRSPKTFAPRPEERNIPSTDITDPAHRLGTFLSTNRRASRIGDQERPWKLTLPGGGGDEDTTSEGTLMSLANYRRHTTSGVLPAPEEEHLPSYEEDMKKHSQSEMLQPSVYVPDEKSRPLGGETDDQSQGQGQGQGYGQAQSQYLHPTRGQGRQINNSGSPVELPVRRDDDSGEEITMSSTAYPGQEWRPVGYSDWEM